jgi:inosine-uridine nucleoside N-ribohydrolase
MSRMPDQCPRVLIDCDPGHDDLIAIGLAARTCSIVGITTVDGNSPLVNTTRNALIAAELFGLDDVPVHAGAAGPIDGSPGRHATEAHGRTGLDGPAPRTPRRSADGDDAVSFIVDTCRAEEGLWLVPIGPLTNIALALRAAPDLVHRVAGVSIMGGSITHGNSTAAAEFNIWFDALAAAEVFEAGLPLRMCGLDLTHQVGIDRSFVDALFARGTDAATFCGELMAYYQAYAARLVGVTGDAARLVRAPLHDPCAVLAITHPELFETRRLHVVVETTGRHTSGMTLADLRAWADPADANVEVVVRADRTAAVGAVLDALLSY